MVIYDLCSKSTYKVEEAVHVWQVRVPQLQGLPSYVSHCCTYRSWILVRSAIFIVVSTGIKQIIERLEIF